MMWFEQLFGFEEQNPEQVRANIQVEGPFLISTVNGKKYKWGSLEVISLKDVQAKAPNPTEYPSQLSIRQMVGNVQHIHQRPENEGAFFQAASQFNLLEMVGPHVSPEAGIGPYEYDLTQGPACAIACGAGTTYRNYFVPLENQIGQTEDLQIDCLSEIGTHLGNKEKLFWQMRNGYALASKSGLQSITQHLHQLAPVDYKALKGKLQIGIQWNTEVTLQENGQLVSQAYCSALPVAYSQVEDHHWEAFSRLILEATFEATLYAALINYEQTGNPKVYLTLVGGGAFGNKMDWILDALTKALYPFAASPLEIYMVSFGSINPAIDQWIKNLEKRWG